MHKKHLCWTLLLTAIILNAAGQQPMLSVVNNGKRLYLHIENDFIARRLLVVSRLVKSPESINSVSFSSRTGGLVNADIFQIGLDSAEKKVLLGSSNEKLLIKLDYSVLVNDIQFDLSEAMTYKKDPLFFSSVSRTLLQFRKMNGLDSSRCLITQIINDGDKTNVFSRHYFKNGDSLTLLTELSVMPEQSPPVKKLDRRIGYFTIGDRKMENPPFATQGQKLIHWNLKPHVPFVFYIDPAFPVEWKRGMTAGIKEWSGAFADAGLGDIIQVKEQKLPVKDTRYIYIPYQPERTATGGGYSTLVDPESGEILQSYVDVSESSLRDWIKRYVLLCGSFIKKPDQGWLKKLKAELIQMLIAHEIGHCLGLQHNYLASSGCPVDSLRSPSYLRKNGFSKSLMDYSYFNYIAQTVDFKRDKPVLLNRVGAYDRYAIAYAYGINSVPIAEVVPRSQWYDDRSNDINASCRMDDLGDDALITTPLGISNIRPGLNNEALYKLMTKSHYSAVEMIDQAKQELLILLGHVLANINGVKPDVNDSTLVAVNLDTQERSVDLVAGTLLNNINWLFDNPFFLNSGLNKKVVLDSINNELFNQLFSNGIPVKTRTDLKPEDLLRRLTNTIFADIPVSEYVQAARLSYTRQLRATYKDRPTVSELLTRQLSGIEKMVTERMDQAKTKDEKQSYREVLLLLKSR